MSQSTKAVAVVAVAVIFAVARVFQFAAAAVVVALIDITAVDLFSTRDAVAARDFGAPVGAIFVEVYFCFSRCYILLYSHHLLL